MAEEEDLNCRQTVGSNGKLAYARKWRLSVAHFGWGPSVLPAWIGFMSRKNVQKRRVKPKRAIQKSAPTIAANNPYLELADLALGNTKLRKKSKGAAEA